MSILDIQLVAIGDWFQSQQIAQYLCGRVSLVCNKYSFTITC